MTQHLNIDKFLAKFKELFSSEYDQIIHNSACSCNDHLNIITWLEHIADLTRIYISMQDAKKTSALLLFMSQQYQDKSTDPTLKAAIISTYLNSLDIDLTEEARSWSINLLPGNLRSANPAVFKLEK